VLDLPTDRKVTSVSFDKTLWANFRAEVKHRGEQIQDVFDRLMASYVSPTGKNTNAAKTVTVTTEEEAWRPRTPRINADSMVREEEEDTETEEDDTEETDDEEEDTFSVVPHLPGSSPLEIDDEPEGEEEADEDDSEEEEW